MDENIQLSKDLGFLRIGATLPVFRVADVDFNVGAIINTMRKAGNQDVQILTFPEMAITGYTIGDLVQHQALLLKPQKGLYEVLNESAMSTMAVIVGMRPGKILYLANEVRKQGLFERQYILDDLHKWLKSFIGRFFANQFKRTCLPEGPKIGSVSLSPRGDWRMPSDAEAELWLEDLEGMYMKLCG